MADSIVSQLVCEKVLIESFNIATVFHLYEPVSAVKYFCT